MPVARVQRSVGTDALPGARRTAAETPTSTGAGAALARGQVGDAIAGLGAQAAEFGIHTTTRLMKESRDRANETANLAIDNKLDAFELSEIYDPKNGALAKEGQDSFTNPEDVDGKFTKYVGELGSTLGTQEQRAYLETAASRRRQNMQLTLRRDVSGKIARYEAEELKGTLENASSLAAKNALDPRRAGEEIQRGVGAITSAAKRNGLGTEATAAAVEGFRSDVHVEILSSLIAQDQTPAAKVYFSEMKGEIKGDKYDEIEKALKAGDVKREAQRKADAIILKGGSLTEQREQARTIDDPDVRDDVMSRIEHEDAVTRSQAREAEAGDLNAAYNIITKSGSVTKIPADVWQRLGTHQPAMRSYAKTLAEGSKPQTNSSTYYRLMSLSADDPNKFTQENLLAYRNVLDDGDFNRMVEIQRALKSGDTKAADKALAGFRTNKDVVDTTLRQYGLDPNAKDEKTRNAIGNLERQISTRVNAAQDQGVKVTDTEVQQIADDILSQSLTVKGSFWGLVPGFKEQLFDSSKRMIDFRPADVPSSERAQIEAALRRAGRPVNDQSVLDLYLQAQLAKRK